MIKYTVTGVLPKLPAVQARVGDSEYIRIEVQLIRIYISNSRKDIIYKILTVLDSRYFVYYVGTEKFFHKLQF